MNFFPPRNAMSVYNIVQKGTYYCAKGKHSNWGNFEGLFKEPFHPPEEVCKRRRGHNGHTISDSMLYTTTVLNCSIIQKKPSGFPFNTRYVPLQLFHSQLKFLLDLLVSRSIGARNCVRLKVQHGPTTKLGAVGHRAQTVPADVLQVGHGGPFW